MSDQPEVRRLTVREIVEETIAYYSEHPRAIDKRGQYRYLTAEGYTCALGRLLLDAKAGEDDSCEKQGGKTALGLFNGHNIDVYLKPQYRGHGRDFLRRLQMLHDGDNFWENGTVSKLGRHEADNIIAKYSKESTNA